MKRRGPSVLLKSLLEELSTRCCLRPRRLLWEHWGLLATVRRWRRCLSSKGMLIGLTGISSPWYVAGHISLSESVGGGYSAIHDRQGSSREELTLVDHCQKKKACPESDLGLKECDCKRVSLVVAIKRFCLVCAHQLPIWFPICIQMMRLLGRGTFIDFYWFFQGLVPRNHFPRRWLYSDR